MAYRKSTELERALATEADRLLALKAPKPRTRTSVNRIPPPAHVSTREDLLREEIAAELVRRLGIKDRGLQ
jgi:hypothetical protein